MPFTEQWGELPRNRILDFLGNHPGLDYPISEIADGSGLSRPSIYRALRDLLDNNMLRETRTLGQSRLFALNTDNPVVVAVLTHDMERARVEAEKEQRAEHKAPSPRSRA